MNALIDTGFLLAAAAPRDKYHTAAREALNLMQHQRLNQDARFDFVDVAQMAIAERLDIRRVYTFDRRDFSQFKPRHTDYLELLP